MLTSSKYGPNTLLTRLPMSDTTYFVLEFGAYCLTHDHLNISNDLNPPQSTPSIALYPANEKISLF